MKHLTHAQADRLLFGERAAMFVDIPLGLTERELGAHVSGEVETIFLRFLIITMS